MHLADLVAFGHFLVNDASACRHPLNVARPNGAAVSQTIRMFDGAGQDVRDGLDTPVRVPGKAGEIVIGNIVSEIIQEQEWIELGRVAEPESPAQTYPGTFQGGLRFN
jgi:NAD dependent epimerase/dehydratase family enzyme